MTTSPFISVLMPIRNEAHYIWRSLGAVLAQDYPLDRLEVIVADGMSTDGTREIVQTLQGQYPNLHLVDNHDRIVPISLNAALRQAKGDIIIRVDGHCEIAPDYVRRCVEHLQRHEVGGVGGPLETVGETPLAQAIAVAMSTPFGVGGSPFRTIRQRTLLVDSVAFPAYPRTVLDDAGPFDEELVRNQDDEYNYRLRKLGGRILLSPRIRSRYYSRSSLLSLWRQYFQYGFWKVRVAQKQKLQMQPRQFVPPAFVLTLLILVLATIFSSTAGWFLLTICAIYLITNLAASIAVARSQEVQTPVLLPLCFATLHVSYGLGFLWGSLRFAGRWRQNVDQPRRTPVPALGQKGKVHSP